MRLGIVVAAQPAADWSRRLPLDALSSLARARPAVPAGDAGAEREGLRLARLWAEGALSGEQLRRLIGAPDCPLSPAASDLLGKVDLVLAFGADISNLRVLLGAGLPVFAEGGVRVDARDFAALRPFIDSGRLLACSADRLSNEFFRVKKELQAFGRPALITAFISAEADDQLFQLFDVIHGLSGALPVEFTSSRDFDSLNVRLSDGVALTVHRLAEGAERLTIDFYGGGGRITYSAEPPLIAIRRGLTLLARPTPPAKPMVASADVQMVLQAEAAAAKSLSRPGLSRLTAPRHTADPAARAVARIRAPLSPLPRSDYTFVLVTGSMRSGTTLMGELLYSRASRWPRHPALSFDNDEIGTFRLLSRRLRSRANIEAECPSTPIPLDTGIIDGIFTTVRESGPADAEQVLDEFARRLAGQIIDLAPTPATPRVVGMKMTHLLAEWDLLKTLYPRHRMIVMVRDPRDVLASLKSRAAIRESAGSSHAILATMLSYHAFLRDRAREPDIKVIRYEDLVNDTEQVVRDVLEFLALDPEAYDWQALRRGDVAENSTYGLGKGETLIKDRGVVKTSIGAFRKRLGPSEVRLVEKLLGEQMRDYGYTPEHADAGGAFDDEDLATLFELRRTAIRIDASLAALDARLKAMVGSGDGAP